MFSSYHQGFPERTNPYIASSGAYAESRWSWKYSYHGIYRGNVGSDGDVNKGNSYHSSLHLVNYHVGGKNSNNVVHAVGCAGVNKRSGIFYCDCDANVEPYPHNQVGSQ